MHTGARKLNLRALWYDRSVKTQLLVAIGAINLLAALVVGAVAIPNTRVATRLEIDSSLEVAQRFVDATIKELAAEDQLDQLPERLPAQLKHLRHVRIMLVDSFGNLTVVSPVPTSASSEWIYPVPRWFKDLINPRLSGRTVRVIAGNGTVPVIIVGEPGDEIAEAWREFYVLALVWLGLNALILAVLYATLSRVLDPLISLARGLLNLEDGDYTTRLAPPKVKEIAAITNRFNTLAGALDTAREENSTLYRQLISVQEGERREIANELHDEAGPCLFGITANASSIKTIAGRVTDLRASEIAQRTGEIISITERLKVMNRTLLKTLRPGPLGHVKLSELLDELVCGLQRRHPDVAITPSIDKLAGSYGEAFDLTLYRCIQEGIGSAIGEHQARSISIAIAEQRPDSGGGAKTSAPVLQLSMRFDGAGPSRIGESFVLTTMTERVRSLGGSCLVEAASDRETTICIEIPVQNGPVTRAEAAELTRERP